MAFVNAQPVEHADIENKEGHGVSTSQVPALDSTDNTYESDREFYTDPDLEVAAPMDRTRALVGWLIVCFSVSPDTGQSKLQPLTVIQRLDQPVA
jgi:hypothetical protein